MRTVCIHIIDKCCIIHFWYALFFKTRHWANTFGYTFRAIVCLFDCNTLLFTAPVSARGPPLPLLFFFSCFFFFISVTYLGLSACACRLWRTRGQIYNLRTYITVDWFLKLQTVNIAPSIALFTSWWSRMLGDALKCNCSNGHCLV